MGFWKGFINVLGFGGENEDESEEYDSSLPTYAAQPRDYSIARPVAKSKNDDDTAVTETAPKKSDTPKKEISQDVSLPGDLFDELIALFNAAQPDFVSKCLSTESQRSYIYNALSEKIKLRLSNTSSANDSDNEQLKQHASELEAKTKACETLKQENRKLQQSHSHQKRALLDRINDLESQVAKSQAEKEKLFTGKHLSADPSVIEANNARIKELEETLAERDKTIAERDNIIAERDKAIAEREEEIANEKSAREQLLVKNEMSDTMINDLHRQAAADKEEYEETCRQQALELEKISQSIELFEQAKLKYESRIKELKDALKEAKENDNTERIAKLNEENASLRHTIENNLYNQANSEMRLRNEIKELKEELEKARTTVAAAPTAQYGTEDNGSPDNTQPQSNAAPRRRGRPKKVRLDDNLDNTDWFSTQKDNSDFGYHEPPHRPSNNNADQLSLF